MRFPPSTALPKHGRLGRAGGHFIITTGGMALALISACAKIVAPPGGPEDKSAPTILSATPHKFQTATPPGDRFIAHFSEEIRSQSVDKQIFVSPRPSRDLNLKVKGDRLSVIFPEPFAANQTYVITLGSGITDLRGNKLGSSMSFAFTRGDFIDTGFISGVVTGGDSAVSGIGLALYRDHTPLRMGDLDTLYPDYFTLSGEDGSFELSYLPQGSYFLLALDDRNKDQFFTYGSERFGLTSAPVRVGQIRNQNLELRLQTLDTSQASVLSVTTTADNLVRMSFMGKVSPEQVASHLDFVELVSLTDSLTKKTPLAVKDPEGESRSKFELHFPDLPRDSFELRLDFGEFYSDGREAKLETFAPFSFTPEQDVTPPVIELKPLERKLAPGETVAWTLTATEPVNISSNAGPDSLRIGYSGGARLPYDLDTLSPFTYKLSARTTPLSGASYELRLPLSLILDLSGNAAGDSALSSTQGVWPADSLGATTIAVENRHSPEYDGEYLLTLTRIEGGEFRFRKTIDDSLTLEMPAGSYILQIAEDSDSLSPGELFDGTLYPLRYAEYRSFYPDTIKIRPRFVTSGIKVTLE